MLLLIFHLPVSNRKLSKGVYALANLLRTDADQQARFVGDSLLSWVEV